MEFNQAIPKKALVVIALCCAAVLCFDFLFLGKRVYDCRNYKRAEGTVSEIKREMVYAHSGAESNSTVRYAYYSYMVDGTRYEGKVRVFLPFIYRAGKSFSVYYDPSHPENVFDRFAAEISILGLLFILLFLIVILAAIRQKSK